ncbi:hypothetical protein T492DRAFT_1059849 [Pavlovales sp. CCMP2436]|nr:hypothetical protein T492DRAFT_1059849 [Pavlovales sp. CCMP2436]
MPLTMTSSVMGLHYGYAPHLPILDMAFAQSMVTMKWHTRLTNALIKPLLTQGFPRILGYARTRSRVLLGLPPVTFLMEPTVPTRVVCARFYGYEPAMALPPFFTVTGPMEAEAYRQTTPDLLQALIDDSDEVLVVVFGRFVNLSEAQLAAILTHLNALTATAPGQPRFSAVFGLRDPDTLARCGVTPGPRVRIEAWLPQQALFAHPKVTMAVHHGGPSSAFEALFGGVASLAVGKIPDQYNNAAQLVDAGAGLRLDLDTLTHASFGAALSELVARRVALGSRARQLGEMALATPGARGVAEAVEETVALGMAHLWPANYALPYFQFMEYDVLAMHLVLAMLALSLGSSCWRGCWRRGCWRRGCWRRATRGRASGGAPAKRTAKAD